MRKYAASAALIAAVVVPAACKNDSPEARALKHENSLRPTFAPEPTTTSSVASPRQSISTTSTSVGTPAGASASTSTTAFVPVLEASVSDAVHDVTPSVDPPPAWADLLDAHLTRSGSGFELRVRLGGGTAPQRASDSDHTMNIASFYDVDGDGEIDYEVWANVSSTGWGSSYFDDVHHRGGYQERSGVTVTPEGDAVVMRFPLSHLGQAARFRWSVSSEWGRYETLETLAAARDEMPDNSGSVPFPGP